MKPLQIFALTGIVLCTMSLIVFTPHMFDKPRLIDWAGFIFIMIGDLAFLYIYKHAPQWSKRIVAL